MPCERKHIEAIREQRRRCCVYSLDAYPDAAMRLDIALREALAARDESPWRSIDLFYSAEDREYVARLSHAHGISALGATPAHALRELSIVAGMIPDEFLPAAPEGVKP